MPAANTIESARAHEAVSIAADTNGAIEALRDLYGKINVTYHLAQTVASKVDAPFVRTTYATAWVSRYLLQGYITIDPIAAAGFERTLPFRWDATDVDERALPFLQDAAQHGITTDGYSVPVLDQVGRRALFSINAEAGFSDWNAFLAANIPELADVAHVVHRKAVAELYGSDELPQLSAREREVLMWMARGKDYKAIAIILGISDHTAKGYLKTIRYKLDCGSMPQAVAKALRLRLISD